MPLEAPIPQLPQNLSANPLGNLAQVQGNLLMALLNRQPQVVDSTPCTWRDRIGIAERRALKLFKDMYGWKLMVRYLYRGYVDFHAKDGRTYRIHRASRRLIEVYQRTTQGKKKLYGLCLVDKEPIPLTDGVLKRLWMLRCNPSALHEQANVMAG